MFAWDMFEERWRMSDLLRPMFPPIVEESGDQRETEGSQSNKFSNKNKMMFKVSSLE